MLLTVVYLWLETLDLCKNLLYGYFVKSSVKHDKLSLTFAVDEYSII